MTQAALEASGASPPPGWGTAPGDDAGALVSRVGQRMMWARATSWSLAGVVFASLLLGSALRFERYGDVLAVLGAAAAILWLFLRMRSVTQGRRVREAAALLSVGRLDLAEPRATEAMSAFCLLRPVTLGAAALLAAVRHGQRRHAEAARLAAFVLARPEKLIAGSKRSVRLLLADALMELDAPDAARHAIGPLYAAAATPADRLPLAEALKLLSIQLTLDARAGRWAEVRHRLASKLSMVELMASKESARLTGLLLRAAEEGGADFEAWRTLLARRAALLSPDDAPEPESA